jgi:hypothetical protein
MQVGCAARALTFPRSRRNYSSPISADASRRCQGTGQMESSRLPAASHVIRLADPIRSNALGSRLREKFIRQTRKDLSRFATVFRMRGPT